MPKNPSVLIWAPSAKEAYKEIISNIINSYGLPTAIRFNKKVEQIIHNIIIYNHSYPKTKKHNFRKAVIAPRTSLIYQISKNTIEIVAFIDNNAKNKF